MSEGDEEAGAEEAGARASPALPGPSQAAILLMALGEEEAASVLRHMEPEEVQALGEAMSAIRGVTQEQIGATLDDFVGRVKRESSLGLGSADYFRSTLTRAIGEERAKGVLARLPEGAPEPGLDALKWMDPRVVARILRDEHPQIVATVLCRLPSARAGEVLDRLPPERHADIVTRVTRLDTVHPEALAELDEIIAQLFETDGSIELSGLGGVQSAAEILNGVSKDAEERILEAIDAQDDELGQALREGMFIFENLLAVADRGMQEILREVQNDALIVALKGASTELAEKIFRNMSARAADILRDDLAAKGPVRLAEVEQAQRDIILVAKRLADEGKIALGGKGDDFV